MSHRVEGSESGTSSEIAAGDRWLWTVSIAIPAAYAIVFGLFFDRVGIEDHDQHLAFHRLQFWNTQLFGLAKQWSPILCGRISLAADPQVPLFSAGMLLGYFVGPLYGLRRSESRIMLDRYHVLTGSEQIPQSMVSRNSVWFAHKFDAWDVSLVFSDDDPALFCVVQSNAGIDPDLVWQCVRQFI